MKLTYSIFLSYNSLRKRKLRSILTILGFAIGISLIVFLISLGMGVQRLIENKITNIEALTIIDVTRGESYQLPMNNATVESFSQIPHVFAASPYLNLSAQISYDEANTEIALYGINAGFRSLEGISLVAGEDLDNHDYDPVVVLSATAADLLGFINVNDAIDKDILLNIIIPNSNPNSSVAIDAKVVGISESMNEETTAYMPLNYLNTYKGFENINYDLIRLKIDNQSEVNNTKEIISSLGYQASSIADTLARIDKFFLIIEFIVGAIGAIAIIVASLGSLNTLTVSLLERTKEIGLLKALGATHKDVYRLFILESLLIGICGAIAGFILGIGLGELANFGLNQLAAKYNGQAIDIFYTPFLFIAIVCVIMIIISLLVGIYPSRRAAKLNILDALRHE